MKQPSEGVVADRIEEAFEDEDVEEEPQKGLFCSTCMQLITDEKKRTAVNGSHLHTFANPHGILFEIGCFAEAQGCGHIGVSTEQWSWFPGFSWQIVICRSCLTHLGWVYRSAGSGRFYGLILDRLVPGST